MADDLSRMMNEPKKFAAYLGITKIFPETELRALAKYVVAKKDLDANDRGKYFFGAIRNMTGKMATRKKKMRVKKLRNKKIK